MSTRSGPEFTSVAPPARIWPRFWPTSQMTRETATARTTAARAPRAGQPGREGRARRGGRGGGGRGGGRGGAGGAGGHQHSRRDGGQDGRQRDRDGQAVA